MSRNLRSSLIRLAHQQPHLRSHLLPLITRTAGTVDPRYRYERDPQSRSWGYSNRNLRRVPQRRDPLTEGLEDYSGYKDTKGQIKALLPDFQEIRSAISEAEEVRVRGENEAIRLCNYAIAELTRMIDSLDDIATVSSPAQLESIHSVQTNLKRMMTYAKAVRDQIDAQADGFVANVAQRSPGIEDLGDFFRDIAETQEIIGQLSR